MTSSNLFKINLDDNEDVLNFLESQYIFRDVSFIFLQNKFLTYFIQKHLKKNEIILSQNEFNKNIIFLKEGCYELSIKLSIKEIGKLINFYNKTLIKEKKTIFKLNLMNEFIKIQNKVQSLLLEEHNFEQFINSNIEFINKIYNEKFNIIISTINSSDILGFNLLENNNNNFFNIKCISDEGIIFLLNKEIFQNIKNQYKSIIKYEKEFILKKILKLLNKLIEVREIRIKTKNDFNNKLNFYLTDKDIFIKKYLEQKKYNKILSLRKIPIINIKNKITKKILNNVNNKLKINKNLIFTNNTRNANKTTNAYLKSNYENSNLSNFNIENFKKEKKNLSTKETPSHKKINLKKNLKFSFCKITKNNEKNENLKSISCSNIFSSLNSSINLEKTKNIKIYKNNLMNSPKLNNSLENENIISNRFLKYKNNSIIININNNDYYSKIFKLLKKEVPSYLINNTKKANSYRLLDKEDINNKKRKIFIKSRANSLLLNTRHLFMRFTDKINFKLTKKKLKNNILNNTQISV